MRIPMSHLVFRMMPAALLALAVGCGGGEPRGDVQGAVTFDGQPVAAGVVSFERTEATGPGRNVPIRNGTYDASGDAGLAPGAYLVRISAGDPTAMAPGAEDDQHAPVHYRPLLPPSWNTQSQLSVEVRDGGNTFNFSGKKGEQPQVDTP